MSPNLIYDADPSGGSMTVGEVCRGETVHVQRTVRADPTLVDTLERRASEHGTRPAFRFLAEGTAAGRIEEWSWTDLARRARAIAGGLAEHGLRGEPVLLLYSSGLEMVAAFFGCLYAGAIAVPAPPPSGARLNRSLPRLRGIVHTAGARAVLATSETVERSQRLAELAPEIARLSWLASDRWTDGDVPRRSERESDVAFLQYTSGSTSTPRGVAVTHASLRHNLDAIAESFGHDAGLVGMGWLPLFHDMGLIGHVLQPVHVGGVSHLMTPQDFLRRPVEWLRAISRFGATTSGGPDFAYALCAARVTDADLAGLDLSSWRVAYTGAERVRPATLRRFAERFARAGFRAESFVPCYGLAESTLMVACAPRGAGARIVRGEASGRAAEMVSVGVPVCGSEVCIVDAETRTPAPEGEVGEIWVRGDSVADGYWRDDEATASVFAARTSSGQGPFLRTGDLGAFYEGELVITGRAKDVVIVRGRQLYPEDVEPAVEACHPAIRDNGVVVFSVDTEGAEQVVVVCEVEGATDIDGVAEAVRGAVTESADATVDVVVLVKKGALPRTSSGKRQRGLTRRAYLEGALREIARVARASRAPDDVETAEAPPSSRPEMEAWLSRQVAAVLGRPSVSLPVDATFDALGLDSVKAVELAARLDEKLGRPMHPTVLYNVPTIARLAAWLVEGGRAAAAASDTTRYYGDVASALERLDRRNPDAYRFDLEKDVPWSRTAEPGLYVPADVYRRLGIETQALEAEPDAWALLQASSAMTMCAAFEVVEVTITLFIDTRWPTLGPTRSIELFREEETKHVRLFRGYAREMARLHPDLAVELDWDPTWGVGFWELFRNPQLFPDERVFHYLFWFFFVAFEEHSIYFADMLSRGEGVQPAWLTAHLLHRREELQHVATDHAYVSALELPQAERDSWSEVCVAWLCQHFETFFAFGPARRLVAKRFPHLAPHLRTRGFVRSPFLEDLLTAPSFQRTRLACPYLRELHALDPDLRPSDEQLARRLPAEWMQGRQPSRPDPARIA